MYRYKQNRQLSFLVKRDTKIANSIVKAHKAYRELPIHKTKSQIILMKKNRLNVTFEVPTEIVAKERPVGRMSLEPKSGGLSITILKREET